MCGIVYAHDFNGNPVNNGVLNLFDAQRHRGLQGFGLFDGQEKNIVHTTTEDKILKWLVKYDSNLLLFHHRYPTSAANTRRTAHPFTTKDYFGDSQYILVHNGHVTNSDTLKKDQAELGIEYQSVLADGTYNDSEALLWDLALFLEGKQDKLKFYGLAAFVCVKLTKGKLEKLYFGTNGNPLKFLRTKDGLALSSEGPGEAIAENVLYTWNYGLKRLTKRELKMNRWNPVYQTSYTYPTSSATYPYRTTAQYDSLYDDDNELSETWGQVTNIQDEVESWLEANGMKPYNPSLEEIAKVADAYLAASDGEFELAYDALEMDYMQIGEDMVTLEEYEQLRVFEEALLWLADDPEWTDYGSRSSRFIGAEEQTEKAKQTALTVVG